MERVGTVIIGRGVVGHTSPLALARHVADLLTT